MTYVYETHMGGKDVVVEYVLSSVTDDIKVVDMTWGGEYHRFNWMNEVGQKTLMSDLQKDMTDRMCKTGKYVRGMS
jgi:hypothetical protein